jgi:CxxC motif-containing protein (DUF1111 family)
MKDAFKSTPRQKLGLSGTVLGILAVALALGAQGPGNPPEEAPAGLDNQTNGAIADQAAFDEALDTFSEVEDIENGLGPTFNNTSCVGCHLSGGAVGGSSQITVLRAGHYETTRGRRMRGRRDQNEQQRFVSGGVFVPATVTLADGSQIEERSLINQRAICDDAQSILTPQDHIAAQRISLSVLGDGYVEAVPDQTLKDVAAFQASSTRGRIHGQAIDVAVFENPAVTAVGRFGAKDQQASLLSFAADAYLNEMGITSVLLPDEVTTTCQPAGVPSINDQNNDVLVFANFMRATKAPSNDPPIPAGEGRAIFRDLECAVCHVESLRTAAAGTQLFGDTSLLGDPYVVPDAIGNKVFHPFSDYLLHDIGTGDGIVQNGGPETRDKVRTMPLWGLRTRTEFMHDGASPNYDHAILRHRGEALNSTRRYWSLTPQQKQALYAFLRSL